ncbi:unnamed protein product [Caenorhabditis auriculariae]|uniref:G-protein coupled receptors family 1 profile domain-containing protein n=1 Tax=Caenorhabditis auriculariae TaxID=2777116 RepID=A0A8S1HL33_9PELO|nr:unnamed protein product [Caenorhabditis auriculariae]
MRSRPAGLLQFVDELWKNFFLSFLQRGAFLRAALWPLHTGMSIEEVPECPATSEADFTTVQFLFRAYLMPLTYLFGIISNAINVVVFSQKSMRSQPVNWFFLVLSISDFIVLVSSFFVFSAPVYAEYSRDFNWSRTSVYLLVWFYPWAQTSHTMSVYVTILVSVHRYLGVCHPFLIRRISSSTAVKIVLISAIIFAFSVQHEPLVRALLVNPTALMLDSTYTVFYRNGAYTLVMFFLPFAILSYVNLRIIATLQMSHNMRREMTKCQRIRRDPTAPSETVIMKQDGCTVTSIESSANSNANDRKENGVTVMLVAITTEFLLFNLLAFATNIIELMKDHLTEFFGSGYSNAETLLVEVSSLFVNFNGASTIAVYLIFGSKYRAVFSRVSKKQKNLK